MTDKRRGLGRGLGALIPTAPGKGEAAPSGPSPVDVLIPARTVDWPTAPTAPPAPARRGARRRRRAPTPARVGGRRATSPRCRWTPSPRTPGSRASRVRGGGAGRAGALAARGRPAAAGRGPAARRGPLRADHGRAPVAGRPGGRLHRHPGDRPGHRRRRSCSATPCCAGIARRRAEHTAISLSLSMLRGGFRWDDNRQSSIRCIPPSRRRSTHVQGARCWQPTCRFPGGFGARAVQTCRPRHLRPRRARVPLTIVGDGPEPARLEASAGGRQQVSAAGPPTSRSAISIARSPRPSSRARRTSASCPSRHRPAGGPWWRWGAAARWTP